MIRSPLKASVIISHKISNDCDTDNVENREMAEFLEIENNLKKPNVAKSSRTPKESNIQKCIKQPRELTGVRYMDKSVPGDIGLETRNGHDQSIRKGKSHRKVAMITKEQAKTDFNNKSNPKDNILFTPPQTITMLKYLPSNTQHHLTANLKLYAFKPDSPAVCERYIHHEEGGTGQFTAKCSEIKDSVAKILAKYNIDEQGFSLPFSQDKTHNDMNEYSQLDVIQLESINITKKSKDTELVKDSASYESSKYTINWDKEDNSGDPLSAYKKEIKKHINQEIFKINSEVDLIVGIMNKRRDDMVKTLNSELKKILSIVSVTSLDFNLNHFSIVTKHRKHLTDLLDEEIFPKMSLKIDPGFYGLREIFDTKKGYCIRSVSSSQSRSLSKQDSVITTKQRSMRPKSPKSPVSPISFGQAIQDKTYSSRGIKVTAQKNSASLMISRDNIKIDSMKSVHSPRFNSPKPILAIDDEKPKFFKSFNEVPSFLKKKPNPSSSGVVKGHDEPKKKLPSIRFPSPVLTRLSKDNSSNKDSNRFDSMNLFQSDSVTTNLYARSNAKDNNVQTRGLSTAIKIKESRSLESKDFRMLAKHSQKLTPSKKFNKSTRPMTAADGYHISNHNEFNRKSSSKTALHTHKKSNSRIMCPKSADGSPKSRSLADHFEKRLKDKDFTPLFK